MQVNREALERQGTDVQCDDRIFHIPGDRKRALFESGSEGVVHLATDLSTGKKVRIKCFIEPHDHRRRRSEKLVGLELPNLEKLKADVLGGAPFGMLPQLGIYTPFAVLMKNVRGWNWEKLRSRVKDDDHYPPSFWPPVDIRATWGYGLATAVMKMEARGFIHADLSPGNVVVNDGVHGAVESDNQDDEEQYPPTDEAGDVALVDFDRYVHLSGELLPEPGQGSPGYASPEIWQQKVPSLGSDRTALAVLIQEFLVTGDTDSREESLEFAYDSETQHFTWSFLQNGSRDHDDAHPLLERKYPALAKLVRDTLAATSPEARPAPEAWRAPLREIIGGLSTGGRSNRSDFIGLLIESDPIRSPALRVSFDRSKDLLDLATTGFAIRASLERDATGTIFLVVHEGAALNVKSAASKKWLRYPAGSRVNAEIGMVLFDDLGKSHARLGVLK